MSDEQPSLFDVEPRKLARATDAATSHAAAVDLHNVRKTHRRLVLAAIEIHGPCTWAEVAKLTGVPEAWKRVSDLLNDGWIEVVTDEYGRTRTARLPSGRQGRLYRRRNRPVQDTRPL